MWGCTNEYSVNYNDDAQVDDGSCIAAIAGCNDPRAFNYDSEATLDDGTCIEIVRGCNADINAFNYDQNVK